MNPWYYTINGNLVKKKKPCMPGDYVHLKSRGGCYRVYYVYVTNFVVMKNRKLVDVPWDDFKHLKGDGERYRNSIK